MATIYRFVIEQKTTGGSGGSGRQPRGQNTKGAAKKGKMVSIFAGEKVVLSIIEKCVLSTHYSTR